MIRRKMELVQYMNWTTAERTLKAYEHVVRDSNFVESTLNPIHKAMNRREQEIQKDPALLTRFVSLQSTEARTIPDEDLAVLTGVFA
jgi:hypothetical protein